MKTCLDAGQLCQFEPRYDEERHPCFNPAKLNELLKNNDIKEIRKLFYYKVYVYDICVKCGRVVKRYNSYNK